MITDFICFQVMVGSTSKKIPLNHYQCETKPATKAHGTVFRKPLCWTQEILKQHQETCLKQSSGLTAVKLFPSHIKRVALSGS